jgi:aminopeptidase N
LLNKTGETLEIMNNFSVGINWIKISWNFVIGEDMSGLYWVKSNDHIIFSTQFEPTHARKVFPCFDNPKYKSTFDIIIITSKNKRVLGNMPIEKRLICFVL